MSIAVTRAESDSSVLRSEVLKGILDVCRKVNGRANASLTVQ